MTDAWVFAALGHEQLWYLLPLLVTVSLVYGATRHEYMLPILDQALRFGLWVLSFMATVFAVLLVISWLL